MARQAPWTHNNMNIDVIDIASDNVNIDLVDIGSDNVNIDLVDIGSDNVNIDLVDIGSDSTDEVTVIVEETSGNANENKMKKLESSLSPILGERRTQDSSIGLHIGAEARGSRGAMSLVIIDDDSESPSEEQSMSFELIRTPPDLRIEMPEEPPDISSAHPSQSTAPSLEPQLAGPAQVQETNVASAEARQPQEPPPASEPNIQAGPSHQVTPEKAKPAPSPQSDEDGQICPICFEPWSNSGDHHLSSLKCGHLFGYSCIDRWVKGKGARCPQCNGKAMKKDIRVLYANALTALDTSERDRVMKDLQAERKLRKKLEFEHTKTKLSFNLQMQELTKLHEELRLLKNTTALNSCSMGVTLSQSGGGNSQREMRLVMHSIFEISKDGGCRVMVFNDWLKMLLLSMPSQVAMFPGYGVKKLNMTDMKTDRFVPLHQKQIRDLAFNPAKNDLLLSVGMDKKVKLTNMSSNALVVSYTAESPLWCCCWNTDDANQFYVGTARGRVVQYDTRNTAGPHRTITVVGLGPVVSMCYVSSKSNANCNFNTPGLIVARLQSCYFVELKDDTTRDHQLPLEGPFTSVSLEEKTKHILVSCRPCQKYPHARHLFCALEKVNSINDDGFMSHSFTANIVFELRGGTTQRVLSRSCIISSPDGDNIACAGDESTQSTCLWDLSSGKPVQQLKGMDTVIDILPVKSHENVYLSLLTEKTVKFYMWADQL
ncbi:E3 ubiquitin-protein ligase RFWD3-like [Homarus americanus]|uniref:RING-type E3 ubiquitin transferase n=1 Tax=Homarus americanus TaxID=6706 RepID=A0A8J5K5N3_HOMAM|nr:E3 ubiquitin-protein ligase RFWD3-like [Homarus americanus]